MTGGRPPVGPGDGSDDTDRRFSEIVAHLQDPPSTERGPESVDSASPAGDPPTAGDPPPAVDPRPAGDSPPADRARQDHPPAADGSPPPGLPPAASGGSARWRPWDGPGGADPADDHFVPPQPPPLPAGDLHFWAILVGLTLGPLLLLLSTVVPLLDGPVWWVLGVVLSVGGFVLLVLRSPGRGDDDWGARV